MDDKTRKAGLVMAGHAPKRRRTDQSDVEARAAIADTMRRFGPWREKLAMLSAASAHRSVDRASILEHCRTLGTELHAARSEIVAALSTAPPRVITHSRVKDVVKALDDVEARLGAVTRDLA